MAGVTSIQIRLDDEELRALDEYRRQYPNPPSRAALSREIVRRVVVQEVKLGGDCSESIS
jgi:hypothetical protein